MMQLLCNGVELDLTDGQQLTFSNTNPLFAFDKISCERTAEFSIPLTETNMRCFGLSHVPAYYGLGMRRKFPAEYRDGVVVKTGYLYVSTYSGGTFKAIFVCGELVGLQNVKNAGKIVETASFTDTYEWPGNIVNANAATLPNYATVRYSQESGELFPSVSVKYIINKVAAAIGVQITLPEDAEKLRIIPDVPHASSSVAATMSSTINDASQPSAYPTMSYNLPACNVTGLFSVANYELGVRVMNNNLAYRVACFVPNQSVKLTFPVDWPTTRFIISLDNSGEVSFIGDYSFTKSLNSFVRTSGTPLAGRTITIERGKPFIFVDSRDYKNESIASQGQTLYTVGFRFGLSADGLAFSYPLTIEGESKTAETGDVIRLADNMPDITVTDLLKAIAAITGRQLNYTDADGVVFEPVDISEWDTIELVDVISVGTLQRTFADYQKRNVVQFNSASNVPDTERIIDAYEIDNDTLKDENVLQTIPFSEGGVNYVVGVPLFINRNKSEDADKYSIANCSTSASMVRVPLTVNDGIDALCSQSTSIELTAPMSFYEFSKITPQTAILYNGTKYVWTASKWTDGKVVLNLSKV